MNNFKSYLQNSKLILEADGEKKQPKEILDDLPDEVKKYDPEEKEKEEKKNVEGEEKSEDAPQPDAEAGGDDFDWGDEVEEDSPDDGTEDPTGDEEKKDDEENTDISGDQPTNEPEPVEPAIGEDFKQYFLGTDDFDTKFINEDNITVRFGKELDNVRNLMNNLKTTEFSEESPLFPEMLKVIKNLTVETFNRVIEATQSNVARYRQADKQVNEADESVGEEDLLDKQPEQPVADDAQQAEPNPTPTTPEKKTSAQNHITNFFGLAKRVYLTVGNEIVSNDSVNSLKNIKVYSWLPAMEETLMNMVEPPEKKDTYTWDDVKTFNSTALLVAKALFDEETDLAKVRAQYNKKIEKMFDESFGATGFAPPGSEQQQ